jgi:hypothetical protein
MLLAKKAVKEMYVPITERVEMLSKLVNLSEEHFKHLWQFLEEVNALLVGFEDVDFTERGIYVETRRGFDPGMGLEFTSAEIYVNDRGLLFVAETIEQNKDHLIKLHSGYLNH